MKTRIYEAPAVKGLNKNLYRQLPWPVMFLYVIMHRLLFLERLIWPSLAQITILHQREQKRNQSFCKIDLRDSIQFPRDINLSFCVFAWNNHTR